MRIEKLSACLVLGLTCLLAAGAGAQEVAEVLNNGRSLEFLPLVEFDRLVLSVTGPCNFHFEKSFGPRDGNPIFDLTEETIDGRYRYDLVVVPKILPRVVDLLQAARKKGDDTVADRLCRQGDLPGDPASQAHGFLVEKGAIFFDLKAEEERLAKSGAASLGGSLQTATNLSAGAARIPAKDFVINDDLIVDGSACIGFDCVNGEVFGFDTLRLQENNLRIKFNDTSTVASFPRNDWQLTANDSANGGASKFSIDDITNSRTPFTVEANARSHSLYVDDGGRIGSRTSTPSVEIHTVDGDTPTLRLQQDGSSGFAPQTWDVAGNETNFFVRDVTNGSTLPFRIRPGAPSSAILIDQDGNVGLGTSSPADPLHIVDSQPQVRMEDSDAGGNTWRFGLNNGGDFVINEIADLGVAEFQVTEDGAVIVNGTTVHPDYVFAPEYELMPLPELQEFVQEHRHLPGVQSAQEREELGGIDLSSLPLQILEKVEELTLYTLQLKQEIDALKQQNAALVASQIGSANP